MNQEEIQSFIDELGNLCGYAHIKLTGDETNPIEYIKLNGEIYSNKNKMAKRIAEYSIHTKEAIELVREYESISDLGKHIDPFIIKYHPSWVRLREKFGFTKTKKDEIPCERNDSEDSIEDYLKDTYLAMGININLKEYENLPLAETIEFLFSKEAINKYVSQDESNHPDFVAFKNAAIIKETLCKEIDYVTYKLGADGFPLISIGKKNYDFRFQEDYEQFNSKITNGYKPKHKKFYKKPKYHKKHY